MSAEKEKELVLKEYESLETTNKHLKAQVRHNATFSSRLGSKFMVDIDEIFNKFLSYCSAF